MKEIAGAMEAPIISIFIFLALGCLAEGAPSSEQPPLKVAFANCSDLKRDHGFDDKYDKCVKVNFNDDSAEDVLGLNFQNQNQNIMAGKLIHADTHAAVTIDKNIISFTIKNTWVYTFAYDKDTGDIIMNTETPTIQAVSPDPNSQTEQPSATPAPNQEPGVETRSESEEILPKIRRRLTILFLYDNAFLTRFGPSKADAEMKIDQLAAHVETHFKNNKALINLRFIMTGKGHINSTWTASGWNLGRFSRHVLRYKKVNDANLYVILSSDGDTDGLQGLAFMSSVCGYFPYRLGISEYVREDSYSAKIIVHEIGHNLGMLHDFYNSNRGGLIPKATKSGEPCTGVYGYMDYAMVWKTWSPCSVDNFKKTNIACLDIDDDPSWTPPEPNFEFPVPPTTPSPTTRPPLPPQGFLVNIVVLYENGFLKKTGGTRRAAKKKIKAVFKIVEDIFAKLASGTLIKPILLAKRYANAVWSVMEQDLVSMSQFLKGSIEDANAYVALSHSEKGCNGCDPSMDYTGQLDINGFYNSTCNKKDQRASIVKYADDVRTIAERVVRAIAHIVGIQDDILKVDALHLAARAARDGSRCAYDGGFMDPLAAKKVKWSNCAIGDLEEYYYAVKGQNNTEFCLTLNPNGPTKKRTTTTASPTSPARTTTIKLSTKMPKGFLVNIVILYENGFLKKFGNDKGKVEKTIYDMFEIVKENFKKPSLETMITPVLIHKQYVALNLPATPKALTSLSDYLMTNAQKEGNAYIVLTKSREGETSISNADSTCSSKHLRAGIVHHHSDLRKMAQFVTFELGHILGIGSDMIFKKNVNMRIASPRYDSEGARCSRRIGFSSFMDPGEENPTEWSVCSKEDFEGFYAKTVRANGVFCLETNPNA